MKTVTAAVLVKNGRILITRRGPGESLAGYWEFPGGKVEPGESLEQCLARELKEELGLVISVGDVLAESEYHYEHGAIRLIAMKAMLQSGTILLTVHDEVKWVLPAELEALNLAPADIPIAQRLKELTL